jgi:hypothetical protein
MFINTTADFPEGAILKLSFRLARSNYPIHARCEVRYCLLGVGIGVEFIGLSFADQQAIEKEINLPESKLKVRVTKSPRKISRRRKKR